MEIRQAHACTGANDLGVLKVGGVMYVLSVEIIFLKLLCCKGFLGVT